MAAVEGALRLLTALLAIGASLGSPVTAGAIEIQPSRPRIEAALERGKAAAKAKIPPDQLYAWFGPSTDPEPRGFLMTKLAGLTVMSAHFALRSETPSETEIDQILNDRSLLVSIIIFGERPDFAVDSYMLMAQGERLIKPIKLRFDGRAARSSVWPRSPAYRAKVVASFSYADFDPRARTKLSVFPARGVEVTFDLDLAQIE